MVEAASGAAVAAAFSEKVSLISISVNILQQHWHQLQQFQQCNQLQYHPGTRDARREDRVDTLRRKC